MVYSVNVPRIPRILALCLGVTLGIHVVRAAQDPPEIPVPPVQDDESIHHLQQQIEQGDVRLDFGPTGYLQSVLAALDIPPSSQALAFAKTSFQRDAISPRTPRALYFNDDVYVGYVQGGVIEVLSVDPELGPVFYTLDNDKNRAPVFQRETENCLPCHGNVPSRILMLSTYPDSQGGHYGGYTTTDRSPLSERFGGWYVTGTHGSQWHMGNITPIPDHFTGNLENYISTVGFSRGANVTDLGKYFRTSAYLQPGSDIIALLVLAHQAAVHNRISVASVQVRAAMQDENSRPDSVQLASAVAAAAEPLVRALLFAGAAQFSEPIQGTSEFKAVFEARGPADSHGRSLRQFDLKRRLFRYPLSYLIYGQAFERMPELLKQQVYRRVFEIFRGADADPAYRNLSSEDRQAILQILAETRPGWSMASAPRTPVKRGPEERQ